MEEIEVKFLNINPEEIVQKIISLGGEKSGEYNYRRMIFDYPDFRLDKKLAWLRLRDEGEGRIVLSYKERKPSDEYGRDHGMIEQEVLVSDFEGTKNILLSLGFVEKFYIENKRIRYVLDGVECDIDIWPRIPPYLELEGKSWEALEQVANKLVFDWETRKIYTATQVYQDYGIRDKDYIKMTFNEFVPRSQ